MIEDFLARRRLGQCAPIGRDESYSPTACCQAAALEVIENQGDRPAGVLRRGLCGWLVAQGSMLFR